MEKTPKTYDDGSSRSDYPKEDRDDHYSNKGGHKQRSIENDPKHIDHWKKKAMKETLSRFAERLVKTRNIVLEMAGAVLWAWTADEDYFNVTTTQTRDDGLQFEQTAFAEFIEKEL